MRYTSIILISALLLFSLASVSAELPKLNNTDYYFNLTIDPYSNLSNTTIPHINTTSPYLNITISPINITKPKLPITNLSNTTVPIINITIPHLNITNPYPNITISPIIRTKPLPVLNRTRITPRRRALSRAIRRRAIPIPIN